MLARHYLRLVVVAMFLDGVCVTAATADGSGSVQIGHSSSPEHRVGVLSDEELTGLLNTLDDPSLSEHRRVLSFHRACMILNRSQVRRLVALKVPAWCDALSVQWRNRGAGGAMNALPALYVESVLCKALTEPERGWADESKVLMNVVERALKIDVPVAMRSCDENGTSFSMLLSSLEISAEQRSDLVERVFLSNPATLGGDVESLAEMLKPAALARLRALLEVLPADPSQYAHAIADALAYVGDNDSLKYLHAAKSHYVANAARTLSGADTFELRVVPGFELRIRMINAQHPPESLLDFIQTPEDASVEAVRSRAWAVRRAVGLGVDSARIRQAVFSYGAPHLAAVSKNAKPGLASVTLWRLKSVCVSNKVFEESDWPGIRPPTLFPDCR